MGCRHVAGLLAKSAASHPGLACALCCPRLPCGSLLMLAHTLASNTPLLRIQSGSLPFKILP